MKAELNEQDNRFVIVLTAETVAEAAVIVRMGMNHTQALLTCDADAFGSGEFQGFIAIGKKRINTSTIPKAGKAK